MLTLHVALRQYRPVARRTELGPRFSEGARRLWAIVLAAKKPSARRDLARRVETDDGTLHRILWGDRLPSLVLAGRLARLGIKPETWTIKPREPFQPPESA